MVAQIGWRPRRSRRPAPSPRSPALPSRTPRALNSRAISVSTTAPRISSRPPGKARYTVARDTPDSRATSSTVVLAVPWRARQARVPSMMRTRWGDWSDRSGAAGRSAGATQGHDGVHVNHPESPMRSRHVWNSTSDFVSPSTTVPARSRGADRCPTGQEADPAPGTARPAARRQRLPAAGHDHAGQELGPDQSGHLLRVLQVPAARAPRCTTGPSGPGSRPRPGGPRPRARPRSTR